MSWKGHLKVIQSNSPAMNRDTYSSERLLRALSSLTLNVSKDGASTTSPAMQNTLHHWALILPKEKQDKTATTTKKTATTKNLKKNENQYYKQVCGAALWR